LSHDYKGIKTEEEILKYVKNLGIFPSNISYDNIKECVEHAFKK